MVGIIDTDRITGSSLCAGGVNLTVVQILNDGVVEPMRGWS